MAEKPGIKERAGEWLFQQGVSTVLLFSILLLMAYGVPWTYKEFKTWHDTSEDKRIAERKESEEKMLVERKAVADALVKSTTETSGAIAELATKVAVNSADITKTNESLKELVTELRKDRIERRDVKGHP